MKGVGVAEPIDPREQAAADAAAAAAKTPAKKAPTKHSKKH
jgi:hypothetical protein